MTTQSVWVPIISQEVYCTRCSSPFTYRQPTSQPANHCLNEERWNVPISAEAWVVPSIEKQEQQAYVHKRDRRRRVVNVDKVKENQKLAVIWDWQQRVSCVLSCRYCRRNHPQTAMEVAMNPCATLLSCFLVTVVPISCHYWKCFVWLFRFEYTSYYLWANGAQECIWAL